MTAISRGEVDNALPLEWVLRGLTSWWQKPVNGDIMNVEGKGGEAEGGQQTDEDEKMFLPERAWQYRLGGLQT